MDKQNQSVAAVIILVFFVALGVFFMNKFGISWGKFELTQPQTVTVTGTAKSQQKSEIANFSAGVNAVNDSKDEAIKEVNSKIQGVIDAAKKFGIAEKDIKTENLSIYQQEETYYDNGNQKSRQGQWRANNSVSIALRDVSRASDFATLLFSTGANNVYGPNFSIDDPNSKESGLAEEAIRDARTQAEKIAQASGRKLGKVVTVNDGGTSSSAYPMYRAADGMGGGGSAPIEPGSSTITKSLIVTFELK